MTHRVALCQSCRGTFRPDVKRCPRCDSGVLYLVDRSELEPERHPMLSRAWRRPLSIATVAGLALTLWLLGAAERSATRPAPVPRTASALTAASAAVHGASGAIPTCGETVYRYPPLSSRLLIEYHVAPSEGARSVVTRTSGDGPITLTFTRGAGRVGGLVGTVLRPCNWIESRDGSP